MFGGYNNVSSPFNNDGAAMNGPTLAALQSDMNGDLGKLVQWASAGTAGTITGSAGSTTGSPSGKNNAGQSSVSFVALLVGVVAATCIF